MMNLRHKILRHARQLAERHGVLGRFQCVNDDDLGWTYVADFIRNTGYCLVNIGYCSDDHGWMYEMEGDHFRYGYDVTTRPGGVRRFEDGRRLVEEE